MNSQEMYLELRRRNLVEFLYETEDEEELMEARQELRSVEAELSKLRLDLYAHKSERKEYRYDEAY